MKIAATEDPNLAPLYEVEGLGVVLLRRRTFERVTQQANRWNAKPELAASHTFVSVSPDPVVMKLSIDTVIFPDKRTRTTTINLTHFSLQ